MTLIHTDIDFPVLESDLCRAAPVDICHGVRHVPSVLDLDRPLPAVPPLMEGIVQLWLVHASPEAGKHAEALLSEEERARSATIRRSADRRLYASSHVALRHLLSAHLERDPAQIDFIREPCPCCDKPHGRPALPGAPLHFSLSHSGNLALIAFATKPVGVDLERLPEPEVVSQVARVLHPLERTGLEALPVERRAAAFARCWTRKEAYLKGVGSGIADNLVATTLTGTGLEPAPIGGWRVVDVPVPHGHAAAYAVSVAPQGGAGDREGV